MLPYLAHEYLNEHWQPAYFADVARKLAAAKLGYAACAELLKNFYNLSLTEQQRALIAEVASPELRETLKDFCTDNWFRQDVFVRGARAISAQRRDQLLSAQTLSCCGRRLSCLRSPSRTDRAGGPIRSSTPRYWRHCGSARAGSPNS